MPADIWVRRFCACENILCIIAVDDVDHQRFWQLCRVVANETRALFRPQIGKANTEELPLPLCDPLIVARAPMRALQVRFWRVSKKWCKFEPFSTALLYLVFPFFASSIDASLM